MNLELAAASLSRRGLGLTDIRAFALQCRDGARQPGGDAAALILLAEKASAFFERHEGIAMTNDALHGFVANLAADVTRLRTATKSGDAALIEALNAFASAFSNDVVI
ncbi:hypothetical protein QCE63_36150 [Caballeronia sp. LZ065]|uniref:hypothetical protein n=1 Tax=Caballeronia sp. LZ065 TaxID=3038571 RepID=UPI00285D5A7A|nr:hypothetical protein [Caballeronia sp. LZ065]MDR5784827.1 hypothetical protein [Caballeronia sp. LZ065]